MNAQRLVTVSLCLLLSGRALAETQGMDKELSDMAEKLATQIKEHAKKKVTVIDFTDLEGGSSELGRYVADQLTVNLVIGKRDFSVLDRANLKTILAEHKLTATGLVDPENAKKLGMFAGVDALILGNIVPIDHDIQLTAKIITTDTAEIVGAARATFRTNDAIEQLRAKPTTEVATAGGVARPKRNDLKIVKAFGDLRVELRSLDVVNGNQWQLSMAFANQNANRSVWVALNMNLMGSLRARITDADGVDFAAARSGVSGIEAAGHERYGYQQNGFSPATEIKPKDSISVTLKFLSADGKPPAQGRSNLQLEFLMGRDFGRGPGTVTVNNLVTDIGPN